MNPLTIRCATTVYGDASQCEIVRQWVDHAGLAELSGSLRKLLESLGDEVADEFWRRTLGPIRRTAFALCSTPLPFAHLASAMGADWNQVGRSVRQSQHLFPDYYELLNSVASVLNRLLLETGTPLIAPLEELCKKQESISVILRNPRMNRIVADYFASNSKLRKAMVVSASQLRGAHHCNALAVIGPCGWFPEYVFAAPRATVVHVVCYRWIRDSWKPGPRFLHSKSKNSEHDDCSHRLGTMPRIKSEATRAEPVSLDIRPSDLLPPLSVFGKYGSVDGTSTPGDIDEVIPACLCHLSGNRAVFVSSEDGASSLIIDTSETGRALVRRVLVSELEPGMYLLLRTVGGGDFIAPLADRILGKMATRRRLEQAEWKELLNRRAAERFGSKSRRDLSSLVCSHLQSQGLTLTRPGNVHYWMSSKCIRPRKSEHFAAIIKFAGIEDRTEVLWSAMAEIDRAHRQAGHLIRKMLLQKISKASLDPLERDGHMDFELGDEDGGSLSAYQIIEAPLQEYEVPSDRIGVLLDLEE